jgi:repressor LexA
MPTRQQQRALQIIQESIRREGRAPPINKLAAGLGVQSRSHIYRLIDALIGQGLLERRGRGWDNLCLIEDSNENGNRKRPTLPLLGRIAAGQPIEAVAGEEEIDLTTFLLGPRRYALRVIGESMIGAGILDGDTVVVESCDSARDGEIIVALIDDQEATLKRLRRRNDGSIMLIAENPNIPPMIYSAERVRIQGVVVAQLRSYRGG